MLINRRWRQLDCLKSASSEARSLVSSIFVFSLNRWQKSVGKLTTWNSSRNSSWFDRVENSNLFRVSRSSDWIVTGSEQESWSLKNRVICVVGTQLALITENPRKTLTELGTQTRYNIGNVLSSFVRLHGLRHFRQIIQCIPTIWESEN
jgi:hypothetical protein